MTDPRVVKPRLPLKIILIAVSVGVVLLAFIVFAVWVSGTQFANARMTGVIVGKEFQPEPEQLITLGRKGEVTTRHKDGEYILTVDVPQKDGSKKSYNVWLNKEGYDAVKVGDSYDVGPRLIKE